MTSLSMMIASGLLLRQSANLFATSTMVRPANLISLSRIIAAGRATLERPRQRPRPNGGEGRDSNHPLKTQHHLQHDDGAGNVATVGGIIEGLFRPSF